MKKLAIAGASAALAALPVVGVFAATSSTFTDTVQVTVADSCTIASSAEGSQTAYDRTFTEEIAVGQLKTDIGIGADAQSQPTVNVACNTTTGTWSLSAVGSGTGATVDVMDATGSGTDIATGTATTGATSNWAFKLAAGTGGTIASGYNTYTSIPTAATAVVTGNAGTTDVSITPSYQVYIGTNQEPDTYTGKVTYTLTYTGN